MSEVLGDPSFDNLMAQAVSAHNRGEHSDALELREKAFELAELGSLEQGRAARDIAASYGKLGMPDEALDWALSAYEIHDEIVKDLRTRPSRQALRERGASALYLATTSRLAERHSTIGIPLQRPRPLDFARLAIRDLAAAQRLAPGRQRFLPDLYQINTWRRASVIESLEPKGNRLRGLSLAIGATATAPLCESPLLDTSTTSLSRREKAFVKARAVAGGLATIAVNALAGPQHTRRRAVAEKLGERILV